MVLVFALFLPIASTANVMAGQETSRDISRAEVIQETVAIQRRLNDARLRYTDRHPYIKMLKADLDYWRRQAKKKHAEHSVVLVQESALLHDKSALEIKIADDKLKYTEQHSTIKRERAELTEINLRLARLSRM